jgi:hypothetical protein
VALLRKDLAYKKEQVNLSRESFFRSTTSKVREGVSVVTGNTKGGSITALLTSCLTGLESAVRQLTIFVFICKKQTNPNPSDRRSTVQ